jgi:hypothetical protein
MGHPTTGNLGFQWITAAPKAARRFEGTWRSRLGAALRARLEADTPPLAAAMTYSYAFGALPVPKD